VLRPASSLCEPRRQNARSGDGAEACLSGDRGLERCNARAAVVRPCGWRPWPQRRRQGRRGQRRAGARVRPGADGARRSQRAFWRGRLGAGDGGRRELASRRRMASTGRRVGSAWRLGPSQRRPKAVSGLPRGVRQRFQTWIVVRHGSPFPRPDKQGRRVSAKLRRCPKGVARVGLKLSGRIGIATRRSVPRKRRESTSCDATQLARLLAAFC
jgi:hypothetical protein